MSIFHLIQGWMICKHRRQLIPKAIITVSVRFDPTSTCTYPVVRMTTGAPQKTWQPYPYASLYLHSLLHYISASLSFNPIRSEIQFFLRFFCLLFPSFTLPALCVAGFYCKSLLIVICVQTPLTLVYWADSKNLS